VRRMRRNRVACMAESYDRGLGELHDGRVRFSRTTIA
jgi:hypothetical protein